jgi:hypothetical protein
MTATPASKCSGCVSAYIFTLRKVAANREMFRQFVENLIRTSQKFRRKSSVTAVTSKIQRAILLLAMRPMGCGGVQPRD